MSGTESELMTKAQKIAKAKAMVWSKYITDEDMQWFITELQTSWWGDDCKTLVLIHPVTNPDPKAFGSPVFEGVFADGRVEHIGYRKPFDTPRMYVSKKLRAALQDQVDAVRQPGHEVHHLDGMFTQLVTAWIAETNITLPELVRKCRDRDLDDWVRWHGETWEPQNLTEAEHAQLTGDADEMFWRKQTRQYWRWKFSEE